MNFSVTTSNSRPTRSLANLTVETPPIRFARASAAASGFRRDAHRREGRPVQAQVVLGMRSETFRPPTLDRGRPSTGPEAAWRDGIRASPRPPASDLGPGGGRRLWWICPAPARVCPTSRMPSSSVPSTSRRPSTTSCGSRGRRGPSRSRRVPSANPGRCRQPRWPGISHSQIGAAARLDGTTQVALVPRQRGRSKRPCKCAPAQHLARVPQQGVLRAVPRPPPACASSQARSAAPCPGLGWARSAIRERSAACRRG